MRLGAGGTARRKPVCHVKGADTKITDPTKDYDVIVSSALVALVAAEFADAPPPDPRIKSSCPA